MYWVMYRTGTESRKFQKKSTLEDYIIKNHISTGIAIKYSKDGTQLGKYTFSLRRYTKKPGLKEKADVEFLKW